MQPARECDFESAEHRRGHGDEDERDSADHPRILHHAAEGAARQCGCGPERRVGDGDTEHVETRKRHGATARGGFVGAEDGHGNGDERIDAGRETGEDAACEGDGETESRARREQFGQSEVARRAGDAGAEKEAGKESHARERGGRKKNSGEESLHG